ncbi:polysaccharide biosynthesis C-terminal domain-containing protein [Xanthomarina sp. F1114]|uniref:murein biosynthesis integral membrane protein MurJ n=1 Tax=Xanthomarina sp. F1114 TaxID=2996019 RepID=UPI00225E3C09|nr:lipid II flippase MurJ [Xanthomarina sp. F1114]MCX7548392.1 polysaccharide biosynthesis C-terminal domain-containing protein [Xanthomarina sp. F1114]
MNKLKHIKTFLRSLRKNPTIINIITVAFITLLVKGLGFYKEIIVAGSFGLSELLDTFFIAALVPGFIYQVFLVAFKSVFIPNYVAEQKAGASVGSIQTTSLLITIFMSLFFMIIAFLITNTFLKILFPNHTDLYYNLIKLQFSYLLPCILFWGMSSLISGLLNVHNEFKYATLYPIFTSISMITLLLFFKDYFQERVLALGMLIGSILEFLFLFIVAKFKHILKFRKPDFKSHGTRMMLNQLPAKASSGFLTGLIPVTDQFFAAQLVIGSVAALNYGLKIPAFFTTIIIIAMGNVLLPYFSKLTLDNRDMAFKELYNILKWLFIGLLIVIIPIILFSSSLVELIFERNEFTSNDTIIVSKIQIIFLCGIPFTICGNIIVRFLTSINRNSFMAYVSFFSMLLNILLDYILLKIYGVFGIAFSTIILQIVRSMVLLKYTTKQRYLIKRG